MGQNCETCAFAFYRPSGVSADDPNPCIPCDCDARGNTNNGDCVKVSETISLVVTPYVKAFFVRVCAIYMYLS